MTRTACSIVVLTLFACSEDATRVQGAASDGLVFVTRDDASMDLARLRIADGEVRTLVRSEDRDESWPYWSPLARSVVFQRMSRGAGARPDLWVIAPGRDPRPLTETSRRAERWPAWSPTSARVVFAFRGPAGVAGLALLDLGVEPPAAALVTETRGHDYFLRPSFSADGELLIAQRRGPDGRGSGLWILTAGAEPRRLTDPAGGPDTKPFFTRDGRQIVFTRGPRSGPRRVLVVAVEGGPALEIAGGAAGDAHSARPSPTRDEIVFVLERDGRADLFLAPLSGGDARRLTLTPNVDEFAPRWSPDGERLAVTAADAQGDRPTLRNPESLSTSRVRVLDRAGSLLAETPGLMPDWMPPW